MRSVVSPRLGACRIGVMVFAIGSRADVGRTVASKSLDALGNICTPVPVNDVISRSDQSLEVSEVLNHERLDATVIVAATVGVAIPILVAAKTLRMPITIWVLYSDDHALPTALQVVDSLRNIGRQCKLVYGDPERSSATEEIGKFVKAAHAVRMLRESRIGQIAYRRSELVCGAFDDRELFMKFGIQTVQISMMEILSTYRDVPESSVSSLTSNLLRRDIKLIGATREDLERAVRLYVAAKKLAKKHDLSSVAINGYPEFDNMNTSAAIACAMLTDEGIMSSYEGDVVATVTMLILYLLAETPVFLAEPYKINEEADTIFFFHRSAPMGLAKGGESVRLYGPKILMNVSLDMNEMTIVRLSPRDLAKFHVSAGEAVPTDRGNEAISEIQVKLAVGANVFLQNAIGNHYAIVPMNIVEELRLFCDLMKIDMIVT